METLLKLKLLFALELLFVLTSLLFIFCEFDIISLEIVLPISENFVKIILYFCLNIISIIRHIYLDNFDLTLKKIIFAAVISIFIFIASIFLEQSSIKDLLSAISAGILLTTWCISDYKFCKKHPDELFGFMFSKK